MSPAHSLELKLTQSWPPANWLDLTILLAVSGGSDSIALLRAITAILNRPTKRLQVAHFNHGIRAEEAEKDEAFVKNACRQLGVKCLVGRAGKDAPSICGKDGIEAAARNARYRFLQETAEHIGARYVVTAHTADDQAETILHRIVRGTGIGGLAGMARARKLGPAVTLIRPLLDCSRRELTAYLTDIGQTYRVDASNNDTRLTRNRIRHELLPMLAERFNSTVDQALLRLGSLAGELQTLIDGLVNQLYQLSVTTGDAQNTDSRPTVHIDTKRLAHEPPYLVRELLIAVWRENNWPMQSMGFDEWSQLADMVRSSAAMAPRSASGERKIFPANVSVTVNAGYLELFRM